MKVIENKSKSSHHKEKELFAFTLGLDEMMDVHDIHCGHFIMYVSQISMLYNLNLYSAICQLSLNKTGRKKVSKKPC